MSRSEPIFTQGNRLRPLRGGVVHEHDRDVAVGAALDRQGRPERMAVRSTFSESDCSDE